MRDTTDIPDELQHDSAFCGRMTDAGLPCQRRRNKIMPGDCPRHNPLYEAMHQLPKLLNERWPATVNADIEDAIEELDQ